MRPPAEICSGFDGLLLIGEVETSFGDDGFEFSDVGDALVDDGLVDKGPEGLGWLQLGAIGREIDEPQALGHIEVGQGVPTGVVEQQDDALVGAGSDIVREGVEQFFKEGLGHAVGQVPFGVAGRWRHKGDDIEPLEAVVTERDGALSDRSPGAPHHGLQADAMLVRGVDLDRRVGMGGLFVGEGVGELFLKAVASSSEADLGFLGRGRCRDQPIACRASSCSSGF